MRALITGGGGHVGLALAAALRTQGRDALLLDREAPVVEGFEGIAADVGDRDVMAAILGYETFDTVFHLAGLGAAAPQNELVRVNVEGTRTVLAASIGMRVIVMSSSAVYGAATDDPITEETALAPAGLYGASKLAAEELACAAPGWVAIARPFNIIGPGQRAPLLQTAVLKQLVAIERGFSPPVVKLGWLGNSRDFIDARDVSAGLLAISEKGASGQAYNLCSGTATKARALVEILVALLEKDVIIQDDTGNSDSQDVAYQRGSADKLERACGWTAQIALARSLADALAWQRAQD